MNLIEKLKHARRASVPMVAIETADQQATMRTIAKSVNGTVPVVCWDLVRGCNPVNDAGRRVAKLTGDGDDDITVNNPVALLTKALEFPDNTIVFVWNWNLFLKEDNPGVIQAMANLRDRFKTNGRTLICLAPTVDIPLNLKGDIVVLSDDLPTAEELTAIVKQQDTAACEGRDGRNPLTDEQVQRAVEAVQGIKAFSAEQAIAMALRENGIDIDHAFTEKKTEVEQTRGLSIFKDGSTFSDLGGLEQAKDLLTKVVRGRRRYRLVLWIDEIGTTGVANRSDSAGVNQDAEGTLLRWLEDNKVYGIMLVGVPGCGKSALCKAMPGEFGLPMISMDLGRMQGSLVGQSQQFLRDALKTIDAVGGGEVLCVATANSIDGLSAAMRSRFTDTIYFDSPEPDERAPIWNLWLAKKGLEDQPYEEDEGWVGRDICHCCEKAWAMQISVAEAARYIVPASTVEREEYARQRAKADGRYLSASKPGVYRMKQTGQDGGGERRLEL